MEAANDMTGTKITHGADTVVLDDKAWWIDAQIAGARGNVVARIDAISHALRYRSGAEMELARKDGQEPNPYHSSASYTGKPVSYMVDLTDADLIAYGIIPGKLVFPRVIDSARPKANAAGRSVTVTQYASAMARLQNEAM